MFFSMEFVVLYTVIVVINTTAMMTDRRIHFICLQILLQWVKKYPDRGRAFLLQWVRFQNIVKSNTTPKYQKVLINHVIFKNVLLRYLELLTHISYYIFVLFQSSAFSPFFSTPLLCENDMIICGQNIFHSLS